MSGKIFVVPRGESWAVRRDGERNDISTHMNRDEALAAGRDFSQRSECELVLRDAERRTQPRE